LIENVVPDSDGQQNIWGLKMQYLTITEKLLSCVRCDSDR